MLQEITCIGVFVVHVCFIIMLCKIFLYLVEALDDRVFHTNYRSYQLAVLSTIKQYIVIKNCTIYSYKNDISKRMTYRTTDTATNVSAGQGSP